MKGLLKNRVLWITLLVVIFTSILSGFFAKYIMDLGEQENDVTATGFYFRSAALVESEEDLSYTVVNGDEATMTLSNGFDSANFTKSDIVYSLKYYVNVDGAWVEVEAAGQSGLTLEGGKLSATTFSVSPILHTDGRLYTDIRIVAEATAPYARTLYGLVRFVISNYTVSYAREDNVIFLRLATNMDAGEYMLTWAEGISPDNADENGILTESAKGPSSVTKTLPENHLYELKFFITDADILNAIYADSTTLEALIQLEFNA